MTAAAVSNSASKTIPEISLDVFLKQSETKPASEYIDGFIYQKPMPQGQHSRLQLKFCDRINAVAEKKQIALALPELRCTFGGRSIVPDVTVFAWSRLPVNEKGEIENVFSIYPDWKIEILLPNQNPMRVIRNILHCLKHGTEMGWLLYPQERSIMVFQRDRQPIEMIGDENLVVPAFLGTHLETDSELNLTVAQVFGWLKL